MAAPEAAKVIARPSTRTVAWVTACAYLVLGVRLARADNAPAAALDFRANVDSAADHTPPVAVPLTPADQGALENGAAAQEPTAPATTPPMNPVARAHYDRGLKLYGARRFAAAIDELRRGFAIEPRREFLFAEAQALRLSGDCPTAIARYQEFIATGPPPLQGEAARLGIDRCGPGRSPAAASPRPAAATERAARDEAVTHQPGTGSVWWRDPWAMTSLGAGIVMLGVAAGFAVASNRARDRATSEQTTTESAFDREWESARDRREIAVAALVGGAVLLAAGGARLLLVRKRQADSAVAPAASGPPASLSPWPRAVSLGVGRGTLGFSWQGRFW